MEHTLYSSQLYLGIVEAGRTTSTSDACVCALLRLCTHEMQRQVKACQFYPRGPMLPGPNSAVFAAAITQMNSANITSREAIWMCMRMLAIQLAESRPGVMTCDSDHSQLLSNGLSGESIDVVSHVSLMKSVLRMNMHPPLVTLLALEPHWVAISAETCSPSELHALAELPELLLLCGYTPGPSLVAAVCSAIARSSSPMHVKVRLRLRVFVGITYLQPMNVRLCWQQGVMAWIIPRGARAWHCKRSNW